MKHRVLLGHSVHVDSLYILSVLSLLCCAAGFRAKSLGYRSMTLVLLALK